MHKFRLVKIIRFYEGIMGRCADLNICVSHSMMQDLNKKWGIKATILYDRPISWMSRFIIVLLIEYFVLHLIREKFPMNKLYQFLREIFAKLILKQDAISSNIINSWGIPEDGMKEKQRINT